jgi:hypothetical protein
MKIIITLITNYDIEKNLVKPHNASIINVNKIIYNFYILFCYYAFANEE